MIKTMKIEDNEITLYNINDYLLAHLKKENKIFIISWDLSIMKEINIDINLFYKNKYDEIVDNIESILNKKLKNKVKSIKLKHKVKRFTVVPTRSCNLACKYCAVKSNVSKREKLDYKLAIQAIDTWITIFEIEKAKSVILDFFGGEPFLAFDVMKNITNYIEKNYPDISEKIVYFVTTNGTIYNNEIIDWILENDVRIGISIDGPKDIHDYLRPFPNNEGSFTKAINLIKILSKEGHEYIGSRATVTSLNVHVMKETFWMLYNEGVSAIEFEPLHIVGKAKNSNLTPPEPLDFVRNFLYLLEEAEKTERNILLITSAIEKLGEPSPYFCHTVPEKRVTLLPNGMLSMCLEVQSPSHELWDLYNIGRIEGNKFKISKEKINFLEYITNVNNLVPCNKCVFKYICSGGCPVMRISSTGSTNRPYSYHCRIARELLFKIIKNMIKRTLNYM